MQTAEFNYEDFHKPRAGDEKLAIRFFVKAKQDGEASQEQGRPIFKEMEYIQIMIPGDRGNILQRPVSEQDRGRFKVQYEHWKSTRTAELTQGTPLESWGLLSLAQIEEFKYFGIRTIEHMAALNDDLAQRIHGAQMLKQKAHAALEIMRGDAPMKKMQAELDKRDSELADLKNSIREQAALIAELQANQRAAPKRP